MQALNIQIFVDVVQLLLDREAARAVFMFDDSPCGGDGHGTARLRSPIQPGQLVRWTVIPIDVQTPIWISRITFGPDMAASAHAATHAETAVDLIEPSPFPAAPVWARSWDGFIPIWGLTCDSAYPYRLGFSFGGAVEIAIDGPALVFPAIAAPTQAAA